MKTSSRLRLNISSFSGCYFVQSVLNFKLKFNDASLKFGCFEDSKDFKLWGL